MSKLLHAGFARLFKNKIFWLLSGLSVGFVLITTRDLYNGMKEYGTSVEVQQLFMNYATTIGIVIAVFISLFLGAEYSDGAVRNKVSVGHKRIHIYLSHFFVMTIASLFFYLLMAAAAAFVGIPLFGQITMPFSELILMLGCIFAAIIAYAAIFTMIAVAISNKAFTAAASVLLVFGLLIAALMWLDMLDQPQFMEVISVNEATDEVIITPTTEPNPQYLSGTKRKIYQSMLDINPAGQMCQLASGAEANMTVFPLYSLGLVAIFTAAGIVLFEKKDIK